MIGEEEESAQRRRTAVRILRWMGSTQIDRQISNPFTFARAAPLIMNARRPSKITCSSNRHSSFARPKPRELSARPALTRRRACAWGGVIGEGASRRTARANVASGVVRRSRARGYGRARVAFAAREPSRVPTPAESSDDRGVTRARIMWCCCGAPPNATGDGNTEADRFMVRARRLGSRRSIPRALRRARATAPPSGTVFRLGNSDSRVGVRPLVSR